MNGVHVEKNRTSHIKNVPDLIRCTQLTPDTEICFIDDNFYPGMTHENIYYINIKQYYYDLSFEELLNRFKNSEILEYIKINNK